MKILIYTFAVLMLSLNAWSEPLTLEEAIDIAINQTARGSMINGNLEVSEQNYFARRINFYLPEISINGSVPAYSVDESYKLFGASPVKQLYKTTDLSYTSYIRLNQSLITGGDIEVRANLLSSNSEYPDTRDTLGLSFFDENTQRGFFTFTYTQPLLKPSNSKYNLRNSRDDFKIAELNKVEEIAGLKKEVIEAHIGLLRSKINSEKTNAIFEKMKLKADIDSIKYTDGVISQEDLLISKSNAIDAELSKFEMNTEAEESEQKLYILLDFDSDKSAEPIEPKLEMVLAGGNKDSMGKSWERSIPVLKAEYNYEKAKRESGYKSAGHGLTGDFKASYSTGQGTVERLGVEDDIDTKGWEVSLNFSLPLWDGGSSGAELKSARLQEEQSHYEYNQARREARAEIVNLVNQINIGSRRLEIMQQQVDLSKKRLNIASDRFDDGQISRIEYLGAKVDYLDSRDKYLEELSQYLIDRAEIDGKFPN